MGTFQRELKLGLCLEGFYLFSKGRNFRAGLRGGSQENIHHHLYADLPK